MEPTIALHTTQHPAIKAVSPGPAPAGIPIGCDPDFCFDPNCYGIPCREYSVDREPAFYSRGIYLMAARGDSADGFSGISCGVAYTDSVGLFGFTTCADQDFWSNGFPVSGGGIRALWNPGNCQREIIDPDGVHAVVGWFYIYAYGNGILEVTENPTTGESTPVTADCSDRETQVPAPWAKVGFGELEGYNPCSVPVVPVSATTWGRIKGHLRP